MPKSNRRLTSSERREETKQRMIREAEAFINRRLQRDGRTQHRGEVVRDLRTDPRAGQSAACPTSPTKVTKGGAD